MAWWGGKKPVPAQAPAANQAATGVRLPPRGRYETDVTSVQKLKLERLGYRDTEMLAVIGREQAEFLIHHLEMEARDEQEADLWEEGREFWSNAAATFCGAVAVIIIVLIAWDHFWKGGRFGADSPPVASVEATPAAAADATDPAAPVRSMAVFKREVAASQARAVRAHPSLGVAGSHFNTAFVARYQKLLAQRSPRLDSSDWPERLAEECAREMPAQYQ